MRRNHGFTAFLLLCSLLTLSCGDDSSPVTPTETNLDTGRAASATIGAGGGSLQVTDATGAVYRLDVPAGALGANTSITATPFKTADLGNAMTPLAPGLRLQPEGLKFEMPSTIAVTLPQAPTGDVSLLLHRRGNQPGELLIATVDGAKLTTEIYHFSEVLPADGTVPQLIEHWNLLMSLYEQDGPSSDIAEQLGYTYLTSGIVEGVPHAEWEADLNLVLSELIVVALVNCSAGDCILGNNRLTTVVNIALAIGNNLLADHAQSQKPLCDSSALEVSIGFAPTIDVDDSPLSISVMQGGLAVEGAMVSISVSGGSANNNSGTTDASGAFATTVEWDGSSASVDVDVTATHPGCATPGQASDSATPPSGPGGVTVTSRDAEINVITAASYNLNLGVSNTVVLYDLWAFKEFSELLGSFDADTIRTSGGDVEGGGMTVSGSATATQMSNVTASGGNSVTVTFEGDVSGDASLTNPPGGENARWESYSASFTEMDVTIRVFSPSVSFQLNGTIDNYTDFSFTGESVSICYEDGQACPQALASSSRRAVGINESGTLVGDPDGGNSYHFHIRVARDVWFSDNSDPEHTSGSTNYSAMANVTLTIGP